MIFLFAAMDENGEDALVVAHPAAATATAPASAAAAAADARPGRPRDGPDLTAERTS
jgi:hypothetical protein